MPAYPGYISRGKQYKAPPPGGEAGQIQALLNAETGETGWIDPPQSGPPVIISQPENQSVVETQTATFNVAATGADSFQWELDSGSGFGAIGGATSSSYTTPATVLADSGNQYRCVCSNESGNTTSDTATLTVTAAVPVITTQPEDAAVEEGQTASFSVVATGAESYQWEVNSGQWETIGGATSASYTTPATVLGDSGNQYRCLVTNSGGTVTSDSATLTVFEAQPPIISQQPEDQSVAIGGQATFSVTSSNADSYQWQLDSGSGFVPISGATANTYQTPVITEQDNGNRYRCVLTNANGTTVSDAATLTVTIDLGDWSTKRTVSITNPGPPQTDYVLRVVLDGGTNSDAAAILAASSDDGSDLRFASGTSLLPFLRGRWDKVGNIGRAFVKVSSLPSGLSSIDIYSGNDSASDLSSAANTGALWASDCDALLPVTRHHADNESQKTGIGMTVLSTGEIIRAVKADESVPTNNPILIYRSLDDGVTWSRGTDLTSAYSNGEMSIDPVGGDDNIWLQWTNTSNELNLTRSTDDIASWQPTHKIGDEQGGGATQLVVSPTNILAFFPNATTGVMECHRSTGSYDAWQYVSDVGTPDGRFEDPCAEVLDNGDIILVAEDEPGPPGDTSNNDIKAWISQDGGESWVLGMSNLSIPPGDHEPGELNYIDRVDGTRELRFYFTTSAYNSKPNNNYYNNSHLGYVVLNVDGTTVTHGPFNTIKLLKGRTGDPSGGVGVECTTTAGRDAIIAWFDFDDGPDRDITKTHQIIQPREVEGMLPITATMIPGGYASGNDSDSQSGTALQLVRTNTSNPQFLKVDFDKESHFAVEADVWKVDGPSALQICPMESDTYIVRTALQSSLASAGFEQGQICFSVDQGASYSRLDTPTPATPDTWFNLNMLFTLNGQMAMDIYVDEIKKTAAGPTATSTGCDGVRLLVDNWTASNRILYDNIVIRKITPSGDCQTIIEP